MPKRRLLQITNVDDGRARRWCSACSPSPALAEVWHVYVLAFVFGVGAAFDAPARQSFVSEIVDPDDLTNAVGLNSATLQRRPHRRARRSPAC